MRPYVLLECQRGDTHKAYVNQKRELTTSLKCNCLFRVRSYLLSCGEWSVSVIDGRHNHTMATRFEGHKYVERLKAEEAILVCELTKNNTLPRNILLMIRTKNANSSTTIKHIYNVQQRMIKEVRGIRSEMQQILKCLSGKNYTYSTKLFSDNKTISDVFFTHPDSIKLVNLFPIVIVMDSTYNTNKYGIPLLEFVGSTSTGLTFSSGFAYMTAEKEENFVWALERYRDLLKCHEYPKVIVNDRYVALMNVEKFFQKATALLCRYHTSANVKSNMKVICHFKKDAEDKEKATQMYIDIMAAWESILESVTKEEYADSIVSFRQLCAEFPIFVDYVESTILGLVKEKVVSAWTNRVIHLGNTTTNRVESTHARLKLYIQNCMGDICKNWESIS
ncbi:hypothetical protein TSUD_401420 [Trifolium subterraneum]|uniref:MULE transposase domain-containing protein n=1 Tax=Trifolium subterraneum TaxID=3900 RepID=A0A2Z6NUZ9_TRISU|nr:hypothetical protein TSUD_401420 [Trifolium subterraneum]